MHIRPSAACDSPALSSLHLSAFGQAQGQEIVDLVNDLIDDETARPLLSLVAARDEKIVGHILFTSVTLQDAQQNVSARILAPLAVLAELQGGGIGGALIAEGLKQLSATGVDLVFVLGHPGYYSKFGFRPASALGFEAPYPIPPEHAEAWMVHALRAGVIGTIQGSIQCAKTLDQPQHWRE